MSDEAPATGSYSTGGGEAGRRVPVKDEIENEENIDDDGD